MANKEYYKKMKKKEDKSSDSKKDKEFIQKMQGDYNSRYNGLLSSEKEIIEEYYSPSYKSRYQ
jgi:hypothetical protein